MGAQTEIAKRLGVAKSVVSRVMNDKGSDLSPITRRKVQVALARRLGLRVDEAFPVVGKIDAFIERQESRVAV